MCCAIYAICCLYFIVIPLDAKVLKFQIGSVKDCQKISRCIGSVFVGHLSPFGNPTARCFWCLSSAEYRSGCGKEGKDHNFLFLQPVVPSEKLNFSSLQGLACLRDARDLWGCFKSKIQHGQCLYFSYQKEGNHLSELSLDPFVGIDQPQKH